MQLSGSAPEYNDLSILCTEHMNHILQAADSAPFGDGVGVVASTLQNGDTLPPVTQCLQTPFQCIPERVGLAATNWAIFANEGFNPISFPALTVSESGTGVQGRSQVVTGSSTVEPFVPIATLAALRLLLQRRQRRVRLLPAGVGATQATATVAR